MRRQVLKGATVLLSAGALVSLGMSPASADDGHSHSHSHSHSRSESHSYRHSDSRSRASIQQTVNVVGNGSSVRLDHAHHLCRVHPVRRAVHQRPWARTAVAAPLTMSRLGAPRPCPGCCRTWLTSSAATPAAGTRELTADTVIQGLADRLLPGRSEVVTEYLEAGDVLPARHRQSLRWAASD